jgi:hypothetical protein
LVTGGAVVGGVVTDGLISDVIGGAWKKYNYRKKRNLSWSIRVNWF